MRRPDCSSLAWSPRAGTLMRGSLELPLHLGGGQRVRRKAGRDGQAAFGPGTNLEAGRVGFDDLGDDGQAETETVRAGSPVRGAALEVGKTYEELVIARR